MSFVTLRRVIRAGLLDFSRNGFVSFSSILIMVETLFILGFMLFVGIILNTTLNQLRDLADVNVYFTTNAPEEQIVTLQKSLQALPEVESVGYVSADEAEQQFRARHKNDQLALQALDELGSNPLGAVLNVKAKDVSQYDAIPAFLNEQQSLGSGAGASIDKINYNNEQHRSALENLKNITNSGGRLGLIIIAIFIITTITTLFNMIRLTIYTSRDEIHVMRLMGAGQLYIRAPFMIEGMLQGLIAGITTLLLFYPLTWWLGASTAGFFGGVNIYTYYLSHFVLFFIIIVGTGVGLGALANFLATRRYIKI